MDNQNRNISKMLEAAAKEVRDGRHGDFTTSDGVEVFAATNLVRITVKKNSVIRPKPTNKTTTWASNWLKPKK